MTGIREAGTKLLGRRGFRLVTPVVAVAVIAILLFGTGAAAACTPPPSSNPPYTVLDKIPLVDAIAANSSMVFAQGVEHCSQIWGISPTDQVSLYATVPVPKGVVCSEGALALAPSTAFTGHPSSRGGGPPTAPLGEAASVAEWGHYHCHCSKGTNNTTLFEVGEGQLYAITQGGTNVTWVANFSVSPKVTENMGLTYDQVGAFHHDLIVTSSFGGKVWLVNSTGGVTLLASLNTYIGGPAVAPPSFGALGGQIIIAEHFTGSIVAVSPSGKVTYVANWSKANAVAFPPYSGGGHRHHHGGGWMPWQGGRPASDGNGIALWGHGGKGPCGFECSFGRQHFVLFVANYSSGAVEAFPAKDLRGFYGDGFIAGGVNTGIGAFTARGATSYFATQTRSLSDIAAIYCPTPVPCGGGYGSGGWGPVGY